MRFVALVLCTVFAVLGDPAIAAPPAEAPAAGSVSAHAAPAQVAPVVDGSVIDDKAWDAAKVITGFWQTTPDEGQPASEHTEVRVLFTETALYIGVINYDRSPDSSSAPKAAVTHRLPIRIAFSSSSIPSAIARTGLSSGPALRASSTTVR